MFSCWHESSTNRPDIADIVYRLMLSRKQIEEQHDCDNAEGQLLIVPAENPTGTAGSVLILVTEILFLFKVNSLYF